jgi:hypothetical protein
MQRRTTYLLIAVAAASVAGVALNAPRPAPAEPPPPAPIVAPERSSLLAALPVRSALGGKHGELFAADNSRPVSAPAPQQARPPAPAAPAMPYRFVGTVTYENKRRHLLAKADELIAVGEGDTLDGVYRVEAADVEKITLRYLPLGLQAELPLAPHADRVGATAAASAPSLPFLPVPALRIVSESGETTSAPVSSQSAAVSGMRAAQLRGPRNRP